MSKIPSISACCAVASLFSFGAQAFPGSPAPAKMAVSEVTRVRVFCGPGFERGLYEGCVPIGLPYVAPPAIGLPYVSPPVVGLPYVAGRVGLPYVAPPVVGLPYVSPPAVGLPYAAAPVGLPYVSPPVVGLPYVEPRIYVAPRRVCPYGYSARYGRCVAI
jgi:hypothetical protein